MLSRKKYLIALDQGTTSSRAVVFDTGPTVISIAQRELTQYYPKSGYIEHDPAEIYESQYAVLLEALQKASVSPDEVAAVGITNQRETAILWDKTTGRPVCNAIVWQCRRSAAICDALSASGAGPYITEATGLRIDAYFSATKIKWVLDNVPGVRERAGRGQILFGTVDTWLIWKLTEGKVHVTDYTNASRTMLFNIRTLRWDETILNMLDIPASILPEVRPSSCVYAHMRLGGCDIPIAGIAGDQQAALFGQSCFEKGQVKNTYGTGCFLLMNTGAEPVRSQNGLLTTIGIGLPGGVSYALEGSVYIGGAVVQWLRDEVKLIGDARESGELAGMVGDTGGVYVVPAFTGLGAPYWDMYARGAIMGLTRGSSRLHLIRAAVESTAYQSKDVLDAMLEDVDLPLAELRVDGGASRDAFLMQFQADILNMELTVPAIYESTALGAALLAGLGVGVWGSTAEIASGRTVGKRYSPQMGRERREKLLAGWKKAVGRSLAWEESGTGL